MLRFPWNLIPPSTFPQSILPPVVALPPNPSPNLIFGQIGLIGVSLYQNGQRGSCPRQSLP